MGLQDWGVILALMLSGAALALEVRRWFEDKPRLRLDLIEDMAMVYGDDGRPKLALRATNIGRVPTTVTNLLVHTAGPCWDRIRGKWAMTAVVMRQPVGKEPPVEIGVNKTWTGSVVYNERMTADRQKGILYVGVQTTHRKKPYMIRVKPKQHTDHAEQERSTLATPAPADPKG